MIEIAKCFSVPYEPDPQVMQEERGKDALLIDLSDRNNLGGGGMPQPPGFLGYPPPPALPGFANAPTAPFNYPPPKEDNSKDSEGKNNNYPYGAPFSYNIPPGGESKESNTSYLVSNVILLYLVLVVQ